MGNRSQRDQQQMPPLIRFFIMLNARSFRRRSAEGINICRIPIILAHDRDNLPNRRPAAIRFRQRQPRI
jgi:hypothetical protein